MENIELLLFKWNIIYNCRNGYPDPEYLEKVKNGLSANGISED